MVHWNTTAAQGAQAAQAAQAAQGAQIEIRDSLPVSDASGRPVNSGWARKPLFQYNAAQMRGPIRRITESDRYVIFSSTYMLILEVLDGGLLGHIGVSLISLMDKNRSTQTFSLPFSMGSLNMPSDSETGSVKIRYKQWMIEFAAMEGGARIIKVDIPNFDRRRYLRGAVVLTPPSQAESLVTNVSWRGEKNAFRLSLHAPCYAAEGVMQLGASELFFAKGGAWGILDWNRGSRPRSDIRFWAAACGSSGGRQIGFSVGYGSADSSLGTDNAFFVDGMLHKLDQVTFHISPSNWLLPWRFTSNDNRLEMIFVPHQERFEHNQVLLHSLKRRQVCGSFSGKVILDDGSPLVFENVTGMAERRKTRF
ncbi:MAG: DUF2804 domain-containing protein [Treponema sp.]|jgi:hypothetical protein|nr:DUF2804 domain-containing protein [Treponema sp.]